MPSHPICTALLNSSSVLQTHIIVKMPLFLKCLMRGGSIQFITLSPLKNMFTLAGSDCVSNFQRWNSSVQSGSCSESSLILQKGRRPVMYSRNSLPTEVSLKNVSVWLPGYFSFSCRGPLMPQIVRCSLLYFLSKLRNSSMASCEGVLISMFMGIVGNCLKISSSKGILNPVVF